MEICARNIQKVQVQKVKSIQIKIILRSIILAPLLKRTECDFWPPGVTRLK